MNLNLNNKIKIKATLFKEKITTNFEKIRHISGHDKEIGHAPQKAEKTYQSEDMALNFEKQLTRDILQDIDKKVVLEVDEEKFVHTEDALIQSLKASPSPLKEELNPEELLFDPETGFSVSNDVMKKLGITEEMLAEMTADKLIFDTKSGSFSVGAEPESEEEFDELEGGFDEEFEEELKKYISERESRKRKKIISMKSLPSSKMEINPGAPPPPATEAEPEEDNEENSPDEAEKLQSFQKMIPKLIYDHKSNSFIMPAENLARLISDEMINPVAEKVLKIDEAGEFLGIVIAESTKKDVIKIMKEHSNEIHDYKMGGPVYFSDLSFTVFFDENDIVNQMEFSDDFKGSTGKGLKIGDKAQKASEIYGRPKMITEKGAAWEKIIILFDKNFIISSIKIHN
jgi:hypothetical protein